MGTLRTPSRTTVTGYPEDSRSRTTVTQVPADPSSPFPYYRATRYPEDSVPYYTALSTRTRGLEHGDDVAAQRGEEVYPGV